MKYLCIVISNLDEFLRYAWQLKEQIKLGSIATSVDGMTARQTLQMVSEQRIN